MNKLKITILTIALVGAANFAMAQAQFAVGIKGGLNFAKLDVSQSAGTNYEGRTGYHAGAFALIKVGAFGIQPELIFSRQGSKIQQPNTQDLEANFDYINIPIIAKFYLPLGLNLQAGPQFGFLTKAQVEQTAGNFTSVKDASKSSDVSIAMGAGWDLPFGLTVDARYNLGVSKVNDTSGSGDVKNRVFQVSVGYKLFKFGK